MRAKKPIRIKRTDMLGNISYFIINKGAVRFMTKDEVSLSLSNVTTNATELRFKLSEAADATSALRHLRTYLNEPKAKLEVV